METVQAKGLKEGDEGMCTLKDLKEPVPLQYRKGGGARLGAGSSRGLQDLEGFSVHPMSNEGKGKPVNDSHQEWGEKRSHLLSVFFLFLLIYFLFLKICFY